MLRDVGVEATTDLIEHLQGRVKAEGLTDGEQFDLNYVDADGNPVIFDPATYYGDREADLLREVGVVDRLRAVVAKVADFVSLRAEPLQQAGAVIGGLLLGQFETLWDAYLPIAWRNIAVFGVLTLVLVFRPQGLLGRDTPRFV